MAKRRRKAKKRKSTRTGRKGCAGVKLNGQLKKGYRWRKGLSGACPIKVKK